MFQELLESAEGAGFRAAGRYFYMIGGQDQYPCGVASIRLHKFNGKKIDGRTRVWRELVGLGLRGTEDGLFWYNPSQFKCQNLNTLTQGAEAAARVLAAAGFDVQVISRLA